MQLGIGSWAFAWSIGVAGQPQPLRPLTANDLVHIAADYGVGVVQIADNLPLNTASRTELTELRDTARERGVAIELGTTGVSPAHLLEYLEIAQFLGSRLVRTLLAGIRARPNLSDAERQLRAALPAYETAGVELALENYEMYTARELRELIRTIDSPVLGVCLDTANSLGKCETPDIVARELGPYVRSLHLKDFEFVRIDSRLGYQVVGRPAGEGMLQIECILREIKFAGADPNMILELWTPFAGSIEDTMAQEKEWVARSLRYLRRYTC